MADPHIKSPMDRWDYTTVIIYRLGFVLAVPMLFMLPWYPASVRFSTTGARCGIFGSRRIKL